MENSVTAGHAAAERLRIAKISGYAVGVKRIDVIGTTRGTDEEAEFGALIS
jgi:hypothetical protein